MNLTKNLIKQNILEVFSEKEANSLLRSGVPDFSDPNLTKKIIQVFQEIIDNSKLETKNKNFTPNEDAYNKGINACVEFLDNIRYLEDNDPNMIDIISDTLSVLFSGQADYNPMNQLRGAGLISDDDKWYLLALHQINKSGGIKTKRLRLVSK